MIPKTIHYCWFGRNPLPKLAKKCIKSWKKYCPDYQIIEWNEDNFDISSAPLYVRQAYEARKWAFVSDYVRLWAMVKMGGIYMDTDVEVVQPLDAFLQEHAFSGFEAEDAIPTGIMGAEVNFPFFEDLLDEYDTESFINEDGNYNLMTNVTRITRSCVKKGLVLNGEKQTVEGFTLYPVEYFCPLSYQTRQLKKTKNTHTIHWFNASWWDEEQRVQYKKSLRAQRIDRVKHAPNRLAIKILGLDKYEKMKKLVKSVIKYAN